MEPIVVHLDMDAFFAACEEQRHPEALGRPLIVGAPPDQGRGRGVVIAANYAARAFGVRSAMPIQEAWRRCPAGVYVVPEHRQYFDMSRRIFDDLRSAYPIEQSSVDEASLDATPYTSWDEVGAFAARLQERVARTTGGLSCSVGVGPNKLVAKVATDHRKPNGVTVVPPDGVHAFLDPLPAKRIPGIGPKTSERLSERGIQTVGDLRRTPLEILLAAFGSHGAYMQRAAQGTGASLIAPEGERSHSMSEERTLVEDTRDRGTLVTLLRRMVGSLERDLARGRYWFRHVALKVRYSDFETHTKQASFPRPTSDTWLARRALPGLLDQFLADRRRVRLIGVRFGDLTECTQRTLLEFAG